MRRLGTRQRSERGAVAILFGVLVIALMMVAALAVDITSQVSKKQSLKNQLDATAVSAGFFLDLGNSSIKDTAAAAWDYYQRNGTTDGLTQSQFYARLDFWCVVSRKQNADGSPGTPARVAPYQIPGTVHQNGVCNPDAVPADSGCVGPKTCFTMSAYQNRDRRWDNTQFSMSCSNTMCAVPCALQAGPDNNWNPGNSSLNSKRISCNTVRVASIKGVPFNFAPAGGIDQGSTGAQVAVACKGSCGSIAPNPMDVVVVADRTPSMSTSERHQLVDGIRSMLAVMTPGLQYVSIGTIARSKTTTRSTTSCPTTYNTSVGGSVDTNATGGLTLPSTNVNAGQWVPLKFYDNYLNAAGAVDDTSVVGRALTCIYNGNSSQGGTSLAAPLKAAARYLIGSPFEANNIDTELNGQARSGEIRKVIIFETDGMPQEWGTESNDTSLGSTTDPMSQWNGVTVINQNVNTTDTQNNVPPGNLGVSPAPPATWKVGTTTYTARYNKVVRTIDDSTTSVLDGGQQACKNFQEVAANAKAQGLLLITIGYDLQSTNLCSGQNTCIGQQGGCPTQDYSVINATYASNILATSGSWSNKERDACRSGSGTRTDPYVHLTSTCKVNVTITYTQLSDTGGNHNVVGPGDQSITDVLAGVAGGNGVPASTSNGCTTTELRAAENGDGDYFFCAASGDDMAPIFVTALSQVSTGVKLLNPGSLW